MKLQSTAATPLAVSAYGEDYITVNGQRYARPAHTSLILSPLGLDTEWQVASFDALTAAHFAALAAIPCDVLLFGSGRRQRFPAPELLQALTAIGKPLEVMDTHAACRTYNLLAGEARYVAAALLLD